MKRRAAQVEVIEAASAPWAPSVPGCSLRWAWRVTLPSGDVTTGRCGGRKADAQHAARRAAQRLIALGSDGPCLYRFNNQRITAGSPLDDFLEGQL